MTKEELDIIEKAIREKKFETDFTGEHPIIQLLQSIENATKEKDRLKYNKSNIPLTGKE